MRGAGWPGRSPWKEDPANPRYVSRDDDRDRCRRASRRDWGRRTPAGHTGRNLELVTVQKTVDGLDADPVVAPRGDSGSGELAGVDQPIDSVLVAAETASGFGRRQAKTWDGGVHGRTSGREGAKAGVRKHPATLKGGKVKKPPRLTHSAARR